jgi:hypothetical protein
LLSNIKCSFFNRGIDQTIDTVQDQLEEKTNEINKVATLLSRSIEKHVTVFARGKSKSKGNDKNIELDDETYADDYMPS